MLFCSALRLSVTVVYCRLDLQVPLTVPCSFVMEKALPLPLSVSPNESSFTLSCHTARNSAVHSMSRASCAGQGAKRSGQRQHKQQPHHKMPMAHHTRNLGTEGQGPALARSSYPSCSLFYVLS